jgi:hypothetical protein
VLSSTKCAKCAKRSKFIPNVRKHVHQLTFSLELYLPSQDNLIEIVSAVGDFARYRFLEAEKAHTLSASFLMTGTRTLCPIAHRRSTLCALKWFSRAIFAARHSRPPPAPAHGHQPWQAPGWWSLGVPASELAQANHATRISLAYTLALRGRRRHLSHQVLCKPTMTYLETEEGTARRKT